MIKYLHQYIFGEEKTRQGYFSVKKFYCIIAVAQQPCSILGLIYSTTRTILHHKCTKRRFGGAVVMIISSNIIFGLCAWSWILLSTLLKLEIGLVFLLKKIRKR